MMKKLRQYKSKSPVIRVSPIVDTQRTDYLIGTKTFNDWITSQKNPTEILRNSLAYGGVTPTSEVFNKLMNSRIFKSRPEAFRFFILYRGFGGKSVKNFTALFLTNGGTGSIHVSFNLLSNSKKKITKNFVASYQFYENTLLPAQNMSNHIRECISHLIEPTKTGIRKEMDRGFFHNESELFRFAILWKYLGNRARKRKTPAMSTHDQCYNLIIEFIEPRNMLKIVNRLKKRSKVLEHVGNTVRIRPNERNSRSNPVKNMLTHYSNRGVLRHRIELT